MRLRLDSFSNDGAIVYHGVAYQCEKYQQEKHWLESMDENSPAYREAIKLLKGKLNSHKCIAIRNFIFHILASGYAST
jgi:hypothetical protein